MEHKPIEIITLPAEEWQAYKAFRLEALLDSPRAFGSSYQESTTRPDSHWQGRLEESAKGEAQWMLFAREGQRLVGMIGAFRKEDQPDTAHIISVYVAADARGRGISKLLMNAILARLKAAGVKKAELSVVVDQLPALALYQSSGFVIIGKESRLLGDGEYHDEYDMVKDLQP